MARARTLFDETLQAWAYTRAGVVDELKNIPAGQFGFRPTRYSRSVTELARHIVESGLMASGELTKPDGNFRRQSYEEFIEEHAGNRAQVDGKARLIALLDRTLAEGTRAFRTLGLEGMLRDIVQFNGRPASRLTWLNHAIAHEEYHRGQLALYARLMGRIPALTRLITG